MSKIIILTAAFPYFPGEQFLEDEIPYWSKSGPSEVVLMPATAAGLPRSVPEGIQIDLSLASRHGPWRRRLTQLIWLLPASVSRLFAHELGYLRSAGKLSVENSLRALLASARVLMLRKRLATYTAQAGLIDVVYSYWNETAAYAACLLKRGGQVRQVVSRAHRFDLYEERRPSGYMPLKRQFVADFDALYLLSEQGRAYCQAIYGAAADSLAIAPLGVPLPQKISDRSAAGSVHVVSVSFCVAVKRLDKVLAAVCRFADLHPETRVKWTHIGDGPLLADLKTKSADASRVRANLLIEFLGAKPNSDVKRFYVQHPVDAFVNASESEGIPVSIMEAMAAGVPTVAPDVGGISDLVTEDNGVLLSPDPSVDEIARALAIVTMGDKSEQLRFNARKRVSEKFNSETNYAAFVSSVQMLATRVS